MPFPVTVTYQITELFGSVEQSMSLYGGLTTFVGPNGSGKTQVLRHLKDRLRQHADGREVRYLSGGRLAHLERFRSDFDGRRGGQPAFDAAQFGGKTYRQYRHRAETAFGDFHTLSVRPDLQIKVAERLRRLFNRDIYLDWDAGNLKVTFSRIDTQGDSYSCAREASGLLHLVVILSALYDDEVGMLLLDEPELSLHPQLQAFLLREMQRVAGDPADPEKKTMIIATHSTGFIDVRCPADLTRIVFFTDAATPPLQVAPDAGELRHRKLQALLARLGENHRAAFFSSCTLLVEGPGDVIICNALDRGLDLYLGAAGTQIVPVIGKGLMPVVAKLMRLIGKTPIVLADLDGLADGLDLISVFQNDPKANKAAQEKGHASLTEFARKVYSDFCEAVDHHWDDIAQEATKHPYWTNRHPDSDEGIARRRSAMAILVISTEDEVQSWSNSETWCPLRRMLIALLNFLETAGCFILRRGTIESYYQFANSTTSSDKVSAATQEADALIDRDSAFIESNYGDIVGALKYASISPRIDESSAVSELLLAVVAPALSRLDEDTSDSELNAIARQILRERASLFGLSNISATSDEPTLQVTLDSTVLNVQGFPVDFPKSCNLIQQVQMRLR